MKIWMVLAAMALPLAVAFLLLTPQEEVCADPAALPRMAPADVLSPCDQNNLGDLYYYGDGIARDQGEALKWFRLAADQGYADAQHNLGEMYFNGEAVERSYQEAYMWLTLAAEDPGRVGKAASEFRDTISAFLTPEQTKQAEARAAAWAPSVSP